MSSLPILRWKVASAKIATGTSQKTILQLFVGSGHHGITIDDVALTFEGVDTGGEPVYVRLVRQTTSGTMSSVTVKKDPDDADDAVGIQAFEDATVEPTLGDTLVEGYAHPQRGFHWKAREGKEVRVGSSDRIGLVVTAGADVDCVARLAGGRPTQHARWRLSSQEVTLPLSMKRTIIQLIADSDNPVLVDEIGVSFQGTSFTGTPVLVGIERQTNAGTGGTSRAPVFDPDDINDSINVDGLEFPTFNPAAGDLLMEELVHPQRGYTWKAPFGRGIKVPGGGRLGVTATSAAVLDAVARMSGGG